MQQEMTKKVCLKILVIAIVLIIIVSSVYATVSIWRENKEETQGEPSSHTQQSNTPLPIGDNAPMEESPVALCDLNQDGNCDATDLQLLQSALGKCIQDFSTPAEFLADADGNGCVTVADQQLLFSTW